MDIIMVKYDVQNSDEQAELALITPSNGTKPYYVLENYYSTTNDSTYLLYRRLLISQSASFFYFICMVAFNSKIQLLIFSRD
jgi:hypothetical protein